MGLLVIIIAFAVILSPPPPPYPPLLPSDQHPLCPLSLLKTMWLGLPPSIIMGARRRNLRLAHGSAKSVCLRDDRYLYHAPPRPYTLPGTLTTPLHATTLHSHLLPAYTPVPHSYLSFGYKLPVTTSTPGLVPTVAKDRATLNIHSTHSPTDRRITLMIMRQYLPRLWYDPYPLHARGLGLCLFFKCAGLCKSRRLFDGFC